MTGVGYSHQQKSGDEMYPVQYVEVQKNGFATTSLVFGILALIHSIIPLVGVVAWLLAFIGLAFWVASFNKRDICVGVRKAGLVTNLIALVICFAWLAWFMTQMP